MHNTFGRCLLALWGSTCLTAEVTTIQIQKREPYANGRSFGATGPYEQIEGVMHFAVDPAAPGNSGIVDIDKAPLNAQGLVEFEADFFLFKPVDARRGNGTLVFDVVNRGYAHMWLSFGTPDGPETSANFLLERGFSVLGVGWQHDIPAGPGRFGRRFRMKVPNASLKGKPIRGLVSVSFTLDGPEPSQMLSDRGHIPYEVADPDAPGTRMSVRRLDGSEQVVPRENWGFGKVLNGKTVSDRGHVYMKGGFEGRRTYTVIYQSENPPIAGLGYAAVRDAVAAVRHGKAAGLGIQLGTVSQALGVGSSQSGRYLRGFVHEGFNRDLSGNRVFDGVLALIAGGNRLTVNYRFAQPSASPGLLFPFADEAQTDAASGESGGLLTRLPADIRPKMMYLNTANEYWRASNGALVHTHVDGTGDFPLPSTSRLYVVAGAQHSSGQWPPAKSNLELLSNPLNYRWVTRAVFLALDRWVSGQAEPPPSRYPRIDKNELVGSDKVQFPSIPGVTAPPSGQLTARAKIGPGFLTEGPITISPPRPGKTYPQWVSRVDDDGNETAGVILPELAVPLGTYTAWNQRFPGAKDMRASLGLTGGFVPFTRNEQERTLRRDPRASLAERYPTLETFLGRMTVAALKCVQDGYLLEEDVASLLRSAKHQFEGLTNMK